jgi:hypothetical protein
MLIINFSSSVLLLLLGNILLVFFLLILAAGAGGFARPFVIKQWDALWEFRRMWPQLIGAALGYLMAKIYPQEISKFYTLGLCIFGAWFLTYVISQFFSSDGSFKKWTKIIVRHTWGVVLFFAIAIVLTLMKATLSASYLH